MHFINLDIIGFLFNYLLISNQKDKSIKYLQG